MRLKKVFSKFNDSYTQHDWDRLKLENPKLWKKLKKQFDTGRKIVDIQLNNGLQKENENTLRYYLNEYTDRFLQYGPQSFPLSFNTLEPFFVFNHHNSILQLHSEEESYGISLVDFLDFITEKKFELDKIDFFENIPEKVIYHFTFETGHDEFNFSNNEKTFYIGSLSIIRQENEVSMLIQAGESFDKKDAEKYFQENSKESLSFNPVKKALGMKFENPNEHQIVKFKGSEDLWAHNIGILFDLDTKSIDLRFVGRDENLSFKMLTDDLNAVFFDKESITEKEFNDFYENQIKELDKYKAVFDFANYCLALPYYVFENEDRIVDVMYETNLSSILKGPHSKREYSSVPGEFKKFAKPLYFIESEDQVVNKNFELDDEGFKIEKTGYWKRIGNDEDGFDKKGEKILGKTWVERKDIYFSKSKGITKIAQEKVYDGVNAGYLYIMRQPVHDEDIFKVGRTKKSVEERKKGLSNTSSPDKFFIIHKYPTKDCVSAEKLVHERLKAYRLSSRREFFRCDLKIIMETCSEIIDKINI